MTSTNATSKPLGVAGLGIVGGTVARAFSDVGQTCRTYDRYRGTGSIEDLAGCGVVFLCVPTASATDGTLDVTEVWWATEQLEPVLDPGTVIVIKSTVPPGTTDRLAEAFPGLIFASVPEFLVADRPMETFTNPHRVVIGCRSLEVAGTLAELMRSVVPIAPIVILEPTEAELVKLASNAFLAAKVATANDLSEVCARYGIEWPRVQAVVGLDDRIRPSHLTVTPERGFGGACLPKDLDGLIAASVAEGYRPELLESIARFNVRIRAAATGRPAVHAGIAGDGLGASASG